MKLSTFSRIELIHNFRTEAVAKDKATHTVDWCVQELLDGNHLAVYVNASEGIFKIANRHRFLTDQDYDFGQGKVAARYKNIMNKVSMDSKLPLVFYGKYLGGSYGASSIGQAVPTVCEYMRYNDFFIHDIKNLAINAFFSVTELKSMEDKYFLRIVPKLYQGSYRKCIDYPDNLLTVIPFINQLNAIKDNEMKGIVIRPVFDRADGLNKRLMFKSLNPKYVKSKWDDKKKEKLKLTDDLVEIASTISRLAFTDTMLDTTIVELGGFNFSQMEMLAGKYVQNVLDNCTILSYNNLDTQQKKLINKELNKLALTKIKDLAENGYDRGAA